MKKYTIEQSVDDGATLQILYEGREVKTRVEGESLDNLFEEYFSDKTVEEKNEIKRKYGIEKEIRKYEERVYGTTCNVGGGNPLKSVPQVVQYAPTFGTNNISSVCEFLGSLCVPRTSIESQVGPAKTQSDNSSVL